VAANPQTKPIDLGCECDSTERIYRSKILNIDNNENETNSSLNLTKCLLVLIDEFRFDATIDITKTQFDVTRSYNISLRTISH